MCRLRFFAMMSAAVLLSGCSSELPASQQAVPSASTNQPSTAVAPKLDGIAKKRDPVLDEAWRRAEGEIASGLTEIRESYSAKEIAAGAKPRVWPQLKLPDTNVTAQLTTTWSNLAIDYKLTLSGKRAALESFLEDHPRMRVRFAQPDGVTTMQFPISAKEFHLAAKTGNANGTSQAVAVGNAQSGLLRYFHAERWYIVWLD